MILQEYHEFINDTKEFLEDPASKFLYDSRASAVSLLKQAIRELGGKNCGNSQEVENLISQAKYICQNAGFSC